MPGEPGLLGAEPAGAIRHADRGGGDSTVIQKPTTAPNTDLIARAPSAAPEDEEIRVFREELRDALADPSRLPDNELSKAVEYDDGSQRGIPPSPLARPIRRRADLEPAPAEAIQQPALTHARRARGDRVA